MNRPNIRFKNDSGTEYPLYSLTSFSEVLSIERGSSPRPIQKYLTNDADGLNWIKIGDAPVNGTRITAVKEKIKKSGLSKTRFVKKGDLILSNSMSFGRPYLLAVDGCIHDGWLLIRNSRNKFIVEFLLYLLSSPNILRQYKSLAGAGVVTNLNKELVSKVILAIPSLEEQQKIASFFSTLDQKIEINEQKLEALEKLKKGVMQKCFNNSDWTKHQLKDVCKSFSGGTPNSKNRSFYNGKIPFIRSGEIHQNITELSVTAEALKNSSAKLVKKGDLLYALYGANSGDCDLSKINGAINQAILCIRPKSDSTVDMLFLKEQLFHLKSKITSKYLQGGQGNLSGRLVMNLSILLPPYVEQLTYSSLFKSFNNKIEITKQKLLLLRNLKQGLMQQMFV